MIQPKNDTLSIVDDKRIENIEEITSPQELIERYPLDEKTANFIELSRASVSNIINLKDDRLIVITGPCSIHDPASAIEYAQKLQEVKKHNPHLFLVMRTYFEKPRTTVGWKGLLNDPYLDDTCNINDGLEIARNILLEINKMWIPTAVEFLDSITPQYIADLVSWGAIWARTTESQEHRKLVSGLSMPIGFKNGTSWALDVALHAIRSASAPHSFLSVTKSWQVAKVTTTGNQDSHIILRWWSEWPNYERSHIQKVSKLLEEQDTQTGIIIDASHGNSNKDYKNQPLVIRDIARQISDGERKIAWVMIEWHLYEWNQPLSDNLKYGVSITDACVDWDTNNDMLDELNDAVWRRNSR